MFIAAPATATKCRPAAPAAIAASSPVPDGHDDVSAATTPAAPTQRTPAAVRRCGATMAVKHKGVKMPRNDVASCGVARMIPAPIIADQPTARVAPAPPKKARRSPVVPGWAWRRSAISHIGSITTAAARRRWRNGAPRHRDASDALYTATRELMRRPLATAVATPDPCPTSSITDRWADPPKISRAPAHAARGSALPRAATPIVSAKGRYPTSSGSIVEAPFTVSRRNVCPVSVAVGGAVRCRDRSRWRCGSSRFHVRKGARSPFPQPSPRSSGLACRSPVEEGRWNVGSARSRSAGLAPRKRQEHVHPHLRGPALLGRPPPQP